MSPMCSRAAPGFVRHSAADTAVQNSVSAMLGVLYPDVFVICSLRIYSKTHQNAIRILLPHFYSETRIFIEKS